MKSLVLSAYKIENNKYIPILMFSLIKRIFKDILLNKTTNKQVSFNPDNNTCQR